MCLCLLSFLHQTNSLLRRDAAVASPSAPETAAELRSVAAAPAG